MLNILYGQSTDIAHITISYNQLVNRIIYVYTRESVRWFDYVEYVTQ